MSTGERVCGVLVLLSAAVVVAPFVSEDYSKKMGDGAFALMFVGLIVGLTAFILFFFFRGRGRQRRALTAGQGLIARWNYSPDEWRVFAGDEVTRQAGEKRSMLKITGVIMVVVAGGFFALDPEAGKWIAAVLAVVWILCWIAARLSVRSMAAGKQGLIPEARVRPDALLLGNELHLWRGWGNKLERCAIADGTPPVIEITYSTPGRASRPEFTVRIPVPRGKETEAATVVSQISKAA